MARKGDKSKQQLLNEIYKKEYTNYLNRVRRQQAQGWFGYEIIPKVKKPSEASINRIRNIKAPQIRAKSTAYRSTTTGGIYEPEQGRRIEAKRRSESAKKAAKTRAKNIKLLQESFRKEFNTDEYLPSEVDVITDVINKEYINRLDAKTLFNNLLDTLRDAPSDPDYYRLKRPKYRMHSENREVLMSKISEILARDIADNIVSELMPKDLLNELEKSIQEAVFAYEEKTIAFGMTRALQLLNGGGLSKKDYDTLLNTTDSEA